MWQYVFKRLLLMIPTVLGAALVIFFLLRAMPGDVCELKLGGEGAYVDEEQIARKRELADDLRCHPDKLKALIAQAEAALPAEADADQRQKRTGLLLASAVALAAVATAWLIARRRW